VRRLFPAYLQALRPSTRPDTLLPTLNPVFKTQSRSMAELVMALLLSCTVFIAVEIEKLVQRNQKTA
jgi:hypothetical protein